MTKEYNLLLILTLLTFFGYSQNVFEPETNLGINIGANISSVRFNPTVSQNMNFGFIGGLSFKHIQEKSLGIQIELNFMQAGWSENLDSTRSYSRRLNYIQFPLMTHFNFGNKKTRFFINFGPYISYLISESETIFNFSEGEEKDYYQTKVANPAEFGLCLGVGFTQYTSIGIIQIEGRGNMSLSNIFKETNATPFSSSKNIAFELTVSYLMDYVIVRKQLQTSKAKIKSLFKKKDNTQDKK